MKKLPYGFIEGTPAGKGDFLCFALTTPQADSGFGRPSHYKDIARGFWQNDGKAYSYLMDDMGWIGWHGSICLMHHPIPVKSTRGKDGMCLPNVWDDQFKIILKKMGYKIITLGYRVLKQL